MRKDLLEELVIETTFKIFENSENLEILADKILEIHNSKIESSSILDNLERDKQVTKTGIKNLLDCMQQGIITPSTKERLAELENRLASIEESILLASSKNKIRITKTDIIKFIRTSLKKEAEGLIKILVKKIVLYDDKIQIHYNYIDKKNTLEDNQECSFYKDSFEKEIENTKISGENYDFALDIEAYI